MVVIPPNPKILIFLLLLIVAALFLFPKNSGFTETQITPMGNGQTVILGYRYECLGLEKKFLGKSRTDYRCFGLIHSKKAVYLVSN